MLLNDNSDLYRSTDSLIQEKNLHLHRLLLNLQPEYQENINIIIHKKLDLKICQKFFEKKVRLFTIYHYLTSAADAFYFIWAMRPKSSVTF